MEKINIASLDIDVNALTQNLSKVKKELDATRQSLSELKKQGDTSSANYVALDNNVKTLTRSYNNLQLALSKQRLSVQGILDTSSSLDRQKQKEIANLEKSENAYNKVQAKIRSVTATYNDLATKQALGIDLSQKDQRELARLQAQITKYNDVLKKVDSDVGKYQRSVGNYASGWNGLSNSINQITREMPAFAVSLNTGFLALSNNIPILFDEIKKVNDEVTALRAQGKPTESVLTRLASSFFSLQTAMSLGVTLLTLYGADIIKWAEKAIIGSDATNEFVKANEALNESFKEGSYKTAITEVNKVKLAFEQASQGVMSSDKALKIYNDTLGDSLGKAKTLQEAQDLFVTKSERYVQATLKMAVFNNLLSKSADLASRRMELLSEVQFTTAERWEAIWGLVNTNSRDAISSIKKYGTAATIYNIALDNRSKKAEELKEEEEALFNVAQSTYEEYVKMSRGINIDTKKTTETATSDYRKYILDVIKAEYELAEAKRNLFAETEIERYNTEVEFSEKRIALAQAEYNLSKKTQLDLLKLQKVQAEEANKIELLGAELAQEVVEREVSNFIEANKRKLTENRFINEELRQQELDRINAIEAKEYEVITSRLALKLATEEETNSKLLELENEFNAQRDALNAQYEQQQKEKQAIDLANQIETTKLDLDAQYQLKYNQLELERQLELENAEKTGAEVSLINEKYNQYQLELERQKNYAKIEMASSVVNDMINIFGRESKAGKALAIMQTTMDTYLGAQKAYTSQLIPGDPTSIIRAVIASASAVGVGIANVRKIVGTKEPKFERGGIFEVGGQRHSNGGTTFQGSDGSSFEAEKGEGIGILSRGAWSAFQSFNNTYRDGLGSAIGQMNIQNNGIIEAIKAIPAPIVLVEDINKGQSNYAKVVNYADL